jgi:hypothetical protein
MRFDHLIGGGSAQATQVARLSQSTDNRVRLLAAGGENDGILSRVPIGAAA